MATNARFHPERRNSPRVSVSGTARVRLNEWSRLSVDVATISRDGFSARADALPRPGSYVALEVPGIGRVEARVVWREDDQFGAAFVRPIDTRLCGWVDPALPAPEGAVPEISEVAKLLASRAGVTGSTPSEDDAP